MRSNREYDYFGNLLEYEYDYFPSYSSTSMSTQKVLVHEYEYTSTITPSLHQGHGLHHGCVLKHVQHNRTHRMWRTTHLRWSHHLYWCTTLQLTSSWTAETSAGYTASFRLHLQQSNPSQPLVGVSITLHYT